MRAWPLFVTALTLLACGRQQPSEPSPEVQFQRASADNRQHGERLARVLGCIGCHGEGLTGEDWSEPGFGRLWTANLTRSATRYTDEQLAQVIRDGARPGGRELWEMPSHLFTQLAPAEMDALILFVRSKAPTGEVHPEPAFEEGARREVAAGTFRSSRSQVQENGSRWPPDAGPEHALGRYIVRATCAECHGLDLRGGRPNPQATPRPDLRMVAAYDPAQFTRLLRTGMAAGNREIGLMSGVARGRYRHFTNAEIAAVYRYLRRAAEVAP
jgi:mono/diheme cytochrome c family protein